MDHAAWTPCQRGERELRPPASAMQHAWIRGCSQSGGADVFGPNFDLYRIAWRQLRLDATLVSGRPYRSLSLVNEILTHCTQDPFVSFVHLVLPTWIVCAAVSTADRIILSLCSSSPRYSGADLHSRAQRAHARPFRPSQSL